MLFLSISFLLQNFRGRVAQFCLASNSADLLSAPQVLCTCRLVGQHVGKCSLESKLQRTARSLRFAWDSETKSFCLRTLTLADMFCARWVRSSVVSDFRPSTERKFFHVKTFSLSAGRAFNLRSHPIVCSAANSNEREDGSLEGYVIACDVVTSQSSAQKESNAQPNDFRSATNRSMVSIVSSLWEAVG